jgi:hypothetical protein
MLNHRTAKLKIKNKLKIIKNHNMVETGPI